MVPKSIERKKLLTIFIKDLKKLKEDGYTQREIAKKIGSDETTVSRLLLYGSCFSISLPRLKKLIENLV